MLAEKEVGVGEVKTGKASKSGDPPKEGNVVNIVELEGTSLL